jgi:hypothetical protein
VELRTIILSGDNDYILGIEKTKNSRETKKIFGWQLEFNEDAFRINVNLNGVTNCYITPDNEYLTTT